MAPLRNTMTEDPPDNAADPSDCDYDRGGSIVAAAIYDSTIEANRVTIELSGGASDFI